MRMYINKLVILPSRQPRLRRRKTWQRYKLFPKSPASFVHYYLLKIRAKKDVPHNEAHPFGILFYVIIYTADETS